MTSLCQLGTPGLATIPEEELSDNSKDVEQLFHRLTQYQKLETLTKIVQESGGKRIIVFVKTKRSADFVSAMLSQKKMRSTSIHGGRVLRDRKKSREHFKKGRYNILVATTSAVCGPDMKNVDIVVNYDLPKRIDEYVRRIEHTGHEDQKGKAVSFFHPYQDAGLKADLVETLRLADQPVPEFLQDGGTGTSQVNNTAPTAVPSQIPTTHPQQFPEPMDPPNCGNYSGQMLLTSQYGPVLYWCCNRSECENQESTIYFT